MKEARLSQGHPPNCMSMQGDDGDQDLKSDQNMQQLVKMGDDKVIK